MHHIVLHCDKYLLKIFHKVNTNWKSANVFFFFVKLNLFKTSYQTCELYPTSTHGYENRYRIIERLYCDSNNCSHAATVQCVGCLSRLYRSCKNLYATESSSFEIILIRRKNYIHIHSFIPLTSHIYFVKFNSRNVYFFKQKLMDKNHSEFFK